MSGFDALVATLKRFAAPAQTEPLKFGNAMDMLDNQAYPFVATLVTLPFLQPFPLGFFALIGSAAYLTLGWQLYQNQSKLSLPIKIRNLAFKQSLRKNLVATSLKIFGLLRKITKPRLPLLVNGLLGKKISGLILMGVGLLVAFPLGGFIPFKNLFPSLSVLFYCTAEIEQDGLMIIFSIICLFLSILFYALILFLFWKFGVAAVEHYLWLTR